eukprot:GHVT01010772.1.p1 GENE.GHVT01010772.1~~GHVT01010772.1.p1  ORF type:complete len:315 (+),score=9.40 GHVT01010772.1:599-1543(+)
MLCTIRILWRKTDGIEELSHFSWVAASGILGCIMSVITEDRILRCRFELPPLLSRHRLLGFLTQIYLGGVIILAGLQMYIAGLSRPVAVLAFLHFAVVAWLALRRKPASVVLHMLLEATLGILIITLSVPVVRNLMSPHQVMITNYEPFAIKNSYGLFGHMTKHRDELIIQGASTLNVPSSDSPDWKAYEFLCKAGDVHRRPCFATLYYQRLDWQMWFLPFYPDGVPPPWFASFLTRLLQNEPEVTNLLAFNPFEEAGPPKYIRVLRYTYNFSNLEEVDPSAWWVRKKTGAYLPPIMLGYRENQGNHFPMLTLA